MVIIIEGIDRVGKTTLCDMIIEAISDYGFVRFRDDTRYAHSFKNMDINTEKINTLQNLMEQGLVDNVILDRYHLTEWVYGGVDRQYKNDEMWDIDKRMQENVPCILIYVVPTDINASSQEHGKNLSRHNVWYNDAFDTTAIENKIKVDYNTLGAAVDYVKEVLGIYEPGEPETETEGTEVDTNNETEQTDTVLYN